METKNYGFIPDKQKESDFVFGAANALGGEVLVPSGQWDTWLPEVELQNKGFEPSACVSFTILTIVEILKRFKQGQIENYSDRFLAYASGTQPQGNSPSKVFDTLRKKGTVKEHEWPYPGNATWETYYATPPQNLYTLALAFLAEHNLGYERVSGDQASMMEALKYSPLAVAVFAWPNADSDGLYRRPMGATSNHYTVCYGYERNKYWKIFDTYDNTHKKLAWDFGFEQVNRVTLDRQIVNESAFARFWKFLREALGL